MEIPIKSPYYSKEEKFKERLAKVKKEKKLLAKDILEILLKYIKREKKLLYTTERNVCGYNDHPFDLIVGNETDLDLCGFEIKADSDNFDRLNAQLKAYTFTFNEVYVVLHKKQKPEWLPYNVGVIRVFDNGEAFIETPCWGKDPFDISTTYEWDALFRSNGLGISSKNTQEILKILQDVRRNILFNRFFADHAGTNSKSFNKFYPFTDKQKAILVGFDLPYHYKLLKKEITQLEKRFNLMTELCNLGQKGLDQFDTKQKKLEAKVD